MTPEERAAWEKRNEAMGPRWHSFWFHVYWLSARLCHWYAKVLEGFLCKVEDTADRRVDHAELHLEKLQKLEEA